MKIFASALVGVMFASTVFAATPDEGGYGRNVFRNCARTPVCAVIYSVSLEGKSSSGFPSGVQIKYLDPGQVYTFKDRHFAVGAVHGAELCENGRPCKCSYIPIPPQGNCMTSPSTSEVVQYGNADANGHGNYLLLKCTNR